MLLIGGVLWSLLAAAPAMAQRGHHMPPWDPEVNLSKGEDLEIIVTTFGPSENPAEWFGHSAITVRDVRRRREALYNYGMFNFDSAFLLRFIKGHLRFWVGPAHHGGTLRAYQRRNRSVTLHTLNISPAKRLEIAHFLANNVKPENRYYTYHHFNNNCATPIRDIIDRATDGQFKKFASKPARMTLRGHVHRHAQLAILDYGMMYAMSSVIDRPIKVWDEMFLPSEMEKQLRQFKYRDAKGDEVSILLKSVEFHKADRPPTPEQGGPLWLITLLAGLLSGGGAIGFALWYRMGTRAGRIMFGLYNAGIGLAFGSAGALLVFMWGFTSHDVSFGNENLFFTSPLLLLVIVPALGVVRGKNPRAIHRLANIWYLSGALALLGVAIKALPWFIQQNTPTVLMMLPLLGGFAVATRIASCAWTPGFLAAQLEKHPSALMPATPEALTTPEADGQG